MFIKSKSSKDKTTSVITQALRKKEMLMISKKLAKLF